jgi:2-polyprenyl-3-methyl-5-hydroxy-6-metoxy-1,4-benzoquinol methylase
MYDDFEQMSLDSFQTEILEVAQSAVNYRKWLARLTYPYLGDNPLEFGSGIGDYAKEWLQLGCRQLTVSEHSPTRITVLQDQFLNIPHITVRQIDIEKISDTDAGYSSIVSLNVIEHLENDGAALRGALEALTPGGLFVAFTPAFPLLMSKFDKAVGHHRRYTKRTARALLENNGFDIVKLEYVNSVGWFAWLLGMRILKITPKESLMLKIWDKIVIPAVSKFESWITPPFGQSILIVGQKSIKG